MVGLLGGESVKDWRNTSCVTLMCFVFDESKRGG